MQRADRRHSGIYVKSFEFDAPDAYTESDVEVIRKQVSGPGWSRVVSVREKRELTEIYFWRERDTSGGLVVISRRRRRTDHRQHRRASGSGLARGFGPDDSKPAGRAGQREAEIAT